MPRILSRKFQGACLWLVRLNNNQTRAPSREGGENRGRIEIRLETEPNSQPAWNTLSATNEMQFTDRELFYTDRIWNSRSVQTVRSVTKISPSHNGNEIFSVPLMRCNLRTVNSSIRAVSEVHGPYKLYGPWKDISHSQPEWNTLSATNEMQFTDRELIYTDRIWSSRSVRTVRSVTKISPSHNGNEIFSVPLMRCNLRTVNSSIRTVSEIHGPYELYGP